MSSSSSYYSFETQTYSRLQLTDETMSSVLFFFFLFPFPIVDKIMSLCEFYGYMLFINEQKFQCTSVLCLLRHSQLILFPSSVFC